MVQQRWEAERRDVSIEAAASRRLDVQVACSSRLQTIVSMYQTGGGEQGNEPKQRNTRTVIGSVSSAVGGVRGRLEK